MSKRDVLTWVMSISAILISFNTMGLYGDVFNDLIFPEKTVATPRAEQACWEELETHMEEISPEVFLSITQFAPMECK